MLIVAAIVCWVLGLANVHWFGASELDWALAGLIALALASLPARIPPLAARLPHD